MNDEEFFFLLKNNEKKKYDHSSDYSATFISVWRNYSIVSLTDSYETLMFEINAIMTSCRNVLEYLFYVNNECNL